MPTTMKKWNCRTGCGEVFLTSELVNNPAHCPKCGHAPSDYGGLQNVTMELRNKILGKRA